MSVDDAGSSIATLRSWSNSSLQTACRVSSAVGFRFDLVGLVTNVDSEKFFVDAGNGNSLSVYFRNVKTWDRVTSTEIVFHLTDGTEISLVPVGEK